MAGDADVDEDVPPGEASHDQLGRFLRARRDAVTPAQVGLPSGQRRRAPGLRRTEVAMLAGVSVEYLTRIEQGRDRNPSAQVLDALAHALMLSANDRRRLHVLAKLARGAASMCTAASSPEDRPEPALLALLDRLEPGPALVVNRLGDILAHTTGFTEFAGPIGMLDGDPPNIVRYLFTDPRAETAHPDWEVAADGALAPLRTTTCLGDEHVTAFVEQMARLAGERFTKLWSKSSPDDTSPAPRRVVHPLLGEVRVIDEALHLARGEFHVDEQRLIVILPADQASSAALDLLHGPLPVGLRVVGG